MDIIIDKTDNLDIIDKRDDVDDVDELKNKVIMLEQLVKKLSEFKILEKDIIDKMPYKERKQYKLDLKQHNKKIKHDKAVFNKMIYMRNYVRNYQRMKMKYDKGYRERKNAYYRNRNWNIKMNKNKNKDNIQDIQDNIQEDNNWGNRYI